MPISLFLVDSRPGEGPLLHRHPYPEVFIVHAGQAEFEIDGTRLTAAAGDILIAPAGTAHRFTNTGDKELSLTAIHTAPNIDTEWLAPSGAHCGPSARRAPRLTQQPRTGLLTRASGRTKGTPC